MTIDAKIPQQNIIKSNQQYIEGSYTMIKKDFSIPMM